LLSPLGDELQALSKNAFKTILQHGTCEDSYELPVPATYVIDQVGVIRFAHVDVHYIAIPLAV